jgi:hypothetical protein
MITVLICLASLAALLQFFVSYARSLVTSYSKLGVSDQVRKLAEEPSANNIGGEEFPRLRQLAGLCPARGDDRFGIQAVGAYYELVTFCRTMFSPFSMATRWLEGERVGCSHFAAVALERRIQHSRSLFGQH